MDEINFKIWLKKTVNTKVASDIVSRVKRVETLFMCDLDDEYDKDSCENLMKKLNQEIKKYSENQTNRKTYSFNVYRYSVNKYLTFKKSF